MSTGPQRALLIEGDLGVAGASHSRCISPLHIVILDYRDIYHPEAGGAEIYIHEIFRRLAVYGHRVTLICGRYAGAPREDRIGQVRVLRVGSGATMNFAAAVAGLRLARRERVDLFVENICKIPFFMPSLTHVPVLPIVLHLFGSTAFLEANPLVASYVWLFERLMPPVYRGLHLVALSESTARDLADRGLRCGGMDIVPPGLDCERYCPGEETPRPDTPLVVYVGRLKRYKGIDLILRALVSVREQAPGVRFAIVGKGDDRPRLEALSRELGLGDVVTFEGFVSEEAKVSWFRRAHVVVYPSPKEGWGISATEAAACGTPVVASHSEGLCEAVCHGSSGFLVPHRDVDAWACRISELLTDGQLRERMGAAAVNWARQFNWNVAAEKVRLIVEQVAKNAVRARGR